MKNRIIESIIISIAIITLGLFLYLGMTYLGDSIVSLGEKIESGFEYAHLGNAIRAGLNDLAFALKDVLAPQG